MLGSYGRFCICDAKVKLFFYPTKFFTFFHTLIMRMQYFTEIFSCKSSRESPIRTSRNYQA